MTGTLQRAAGLAVIVLAVAGCESDRGELRAWMDETRRTTPLIKEKIAEPKSFEPFRYPSSGETDPFSVAKLRVGAVEAARTGNGLRPDVTRRRLYLETMNEILPTLQNKVILDDKASNVLPFLPLQQARPAPAAQQ